VCDGASTTEQHRNTRRHLQTSHIHPVSDKTAATFTEPSLYLLLDCAVAAVQAKPTLTGMVVALMPLLRALGLAILRNVIQQRDHTIDWRVRPPCCPACKVALTRSRHVRQTRRYTLLGILVYERRNGLCPECNRSEYPTDWALGVLDGLHGHSQEFANMVGLLTTLMSNAKAMELFEKCFGFAVSTTLSRAITIGVGTRMYELEQQRAQYYWELRTAEPEKLEPPPAALRQLKRIKKVYVMMDDSKLGIQEGKRGRGAPKRVRDESNEHKQLRKAMRLEKAKAAKAAKRGKPGPNAPTTVPKDDDDSGFRNVRALLIFSEADLAGISKGRHEILRRRVVAHIGTLEEWRKFVHMALAEEGVYTAEEVVVIADGGAGIWEMVEELLPPTRERKVTQVLDFYHATSHLWTAARALKGSETAAQKRACIRWVQPLLAAVRAGKVANVIQRLGKLKLKGKAAEEVAKTKKYFETHRKRMRYAWLRERGTLIGSGAMESVHAWVIQPRCRLPGMRWSVAGANAMLRLRCAWASGRWDEKWDQAARAPLPPINASVEKKAA
jgi:hypothetical protein